MGESHENLLKVVRHCQESLDKYTENRNDSKLLHYLQKLYKLPIRVVHLEETGVGRTVNGLRKLGGDVGDSAKSLVAKWKEMVVGEQEEEDDEDEEEEDEDDEDGYQTGEDHSTDSDDNDSRDEKVNDTSSSHRKSDSHRTDDTDRHKEKKHKHGSSRSDYSYSSEKEVKKESKRDKDKHHHRHNGHSKHKSHKRKSDSSSSEDERPRKKSKKYDDEDRHKSKRCIESDNDTEEKHREKKHKSDKHKSEHRSKKHREESPVNEETQKSTKSKDKHKESSSKDKHRSSSNGNNNTSSSNNKKEYSDKHEHSKKSKDKDKKSKQKDKERDKSEDSKTKTPKSNKVSKESFVHSGICSGSGASFAEALGMCEPSSSKSSSKKKPPSEKKEKSSTKVPEESVPKLLKEPTLEPIDINISSLLPPITPNYRPLGSLMTSDAQPKKCMSESEALTSIITSKNQRTKVYSGNKVVYGKVPSLFDLCTRVLQDNIDALEYTGGVPYVVLKPILEKANANQLYVMEHHNPYLIEDTDELWGLHCQKEFRNKKRQEMETWREMYLRCLDERDAKLKALTANIKQSQDKSLPVRMTKLAYVDAVAKPPRNIARKQAKNGTAFDYKKPAITPSARLNSIATSGEAGKVAVPNPGARAVERSSGHAATKPKKAPLMLKSISSFKNRFKR